MATTVNNSARVRYSEMLKAKLIATQQLKDGVIFNTDYEGQPSAGSVRIPYRAAEVAVKEYTRGAGISGGIDAGAATSYITFDITFDRAIAEVIDGYDAASVPANLVAERLDSAGNSMAVTIDQEATKVLLASTSIDAALDPITSSTIYNCVVDEMVKLDNDFVPALGRYILVTPETYALMLKDTSNFIRQGDMSQEIKATGAIGEYCGCAVYKLVLTAAQKNLNPYFMFAIGHPKFATRCVEMTVPPFIQDLNGDAVFVNAVAVKARYVFDHKLIDVKGVRIFNQMTNLTLAFASDATGKTICTVTGAVTGTSTYRYRLNPAVKAIYGQTAVNGTNGFVTFTSASTSIAVTAGDTFEVVQVLTSTDKVVSRGEHVMLAAEIG